MPRTDLAPGQPQGPAGPIPIPVPIPTAPDDAIDSPSSIDSPNERAYGTFEVSVIDVDGDNASQSLSQSQSQHQSRSRPPPPTSASTSPSSPTSCCSSDDCCLVTGFLWMPFRWRTYQTVLFHLATFGFAVGTTVWTVLLALAACCWPSRRLYERMPHALYALLRVETWLFNAISPPAERVLVYAVSPPPTEASVRAFCFYGNLFFGGIKLVCSAIPGAISAGLYLWSLQHVVVAIIAGVSPVQDQGASSMDDDAGADTDIAILLSLLTVYGAAVLLQICAHISRHVTIFFCAEYLLSASSGSGSGSEPL